MTDQQINIIGFIILAALFYYVQIYRPRKKMFTPGELMVKPVMNQGERNMHTIIGNTFPHPHIIKNNVSLDDLLYSPDMDKKAHFHKTMQQLHVKWLVLDENLTPVLAVDYAEGNDEMKLNYLSQAGVGCCLFFTDTAEEEIINVLSDAAQQMNTLQSINEPQRTPTSPLTI